MHFMESFDRFAGRWMPFLVIGGLCAGIFFSEEIGKLSFLVSFLFFFMTLAGTIDASFHQLLDIAKKPMPLILTLLFTHIVIPLLALGLGRFLFPQNQNFVTGVVLEYVVPCAIASLMWSSLANGNSILSLSIVLLDTLIAPFLLPLSLHILLGASISIDVPSMMLNLLWMVALPAFLSMLLNQLTDGKAGKRLAPLLAPYGKIALLLIVTINTTRIAPLLRHMTPILFAVAALILTLAISGYILGWLGSRLLHQPADISASMTLCCGMRNINAGAVIAAAYFPPEVMFPVMIGTLFQQLLASISTHLLEWQKQKGEAAKKVSEA